MDQDGDQDVTWAEFLQYFDRTGGVAKEEPRQAYSMGRSVTENRSFLNSFPMISTWVQNCFTSNYQTITLNS